jgi:glucosamine-6-phosphate deaminase
MTVMQNPLHSCGGDWSCVPPEANTIGPRRSSARATAAAGWTGHRRQIWWQRFIARPVTHGPVSEFLPGSVLQTAPTDYTPLGGVADDVDVSMA